MAALQDLNVTTKFRSSLEGSRWGLDNLQTLVPILPF